jgi:hypothetical protein
MAEYLLLFRGLDWQNQHSPEELQKMMERWTAWFEGLGRSGRLKGSNPLHPVGKTVFGKTGRIEDGPFAEAKEAVGGYFLIDAASLDDAVEVARACPTLEYGALVEVRPVAAQCPVFEELAQTRAAGASA